MKYDVVIVASGKGTRANLGYNKAFYKFQNNQTVLQKAMEPFIEDNECSKIIVVTNKDSFDMVYKTDKLVLTSGGKLRKDSVLNGLNKVESEYVLIHDAARPFLNIEALNSLKQEVLIRDAAILAHKATDTIKVVKDGIIVKTIDRDTIYMAETPQAFKTKIINECFEKCGDLDFTDEASLLEHFGYKVYIVEDKYNNKKLTLQEDFQNL